MPESLRNQIFDAVKMQQRSHTATHITDAVMNVLAAQDERLARAMFIHVCTPAKFDSAASWDEGRAARQSWIDMARRVIEEMGR